MLTRSRHTQAHKKLGDLHRRWVQANQWLAPAVEFLPQLLILPVVLFVVGLLDSVFSSSLPLSRPFAPIFIAGLISATFAIAVAAYTLWTVFHGWIHPDSSPFQSTISQLWVLHGPSIAYRIKQASRSVVRHCQSCLAWLTCFWVSAAYRTMAIETSAHDVRNDPFGTRRPDVPQDTSAPMATLELHDAEAFHATLQATHDDDVLDQAVAAYPYLISECATRFRPIVLKQEYVEPTIQFNVMSLAAYEVESLAYSLSDEASVRTNITAAAFIANPLTPRTFTSQCLHINYCCTQDY